MGFDHASRAPAFRALSEEDAGVAVLALEGELDLATVDRFAEATRAFRAGDALVIDGTALEFMDSTGLRQLLALYQTLGDRLVIACPPDGPIRRLFEVAGVDGVITIAPSREDAVREACAR